MSVAKHIEITADSTKGFEDAVQRGVDTAAKTVKGIRSAWVKDQQVLVEGNNITTYRVNMKVTFVLED
ncbi:MAG: dodecin family protein [Gemmatimonadota bacterium]|jgi:flavin-binding protein dodecin